MLDHAREAFAGTSIRHPHALLSTLTAQAQVPHRIVASVLQAIADDLGIRIKTWRRPAPTS